jgi:hypothetical protein
MKSFIMTALLVSIWATSAFAWLSSLQIEPPDPTIGEPVTITVTGYMPDSCWSLLGHDCLDVVEQEIVLEVNTYNCVGRECQFCLAVLVPFEVECTYEFADPGIYNVLAVEHWDSLHPIFVLDLNTSFEVSESVAAEARTWGDIKALYH